jgi:selenocysteine-specific elongation factor
LPRDLEPACARIRAALAARPSDPPSRKELAFDANSQQALRFLRETGEVVELNDDAILSAKSFARIQSGIVEFLRHKEPATVSDLRQALGTTRRILVPLLEQLDRDGVTSRQGDRRILRRS